MGWGGGRGGGGGVLPLISVIPPLTASTSMDSLNFFFHSRRICQLRVFPHANHGQCLAR